MASFFRRLLGYPDTPLLDPAATYPPEVLAIMARFKASNPWLREGPENTRTHKFNSALRGLRSFYGVDVRANYRRIRIPQSDSGNSHFNTRRRLIVMEGRFSVVTFLHEFAHAMGMDEQGAVHWSTNLFAQTFPEKMPALESRGHMLVRRGASKGEDPGDDGIETDGGMC